MEEWAYNKNELKTQTSHIELWRKLIISTEETLRHGEFCCNGSLMHLLIQIDLP